jgi:hypothetical protein
MLIAEYELKILKAYSACAKHHEEYADHALNEVFAENTSNTSNKQICSFSSEVAYSDRLWWCNKPGAEYLMLGPL